MTINEGCDNWEQGDDGEALAALFHALSEPPRLALLTHLSGGEHREHDRRPTDADA